MSETYTLNDLQYAEQGAGPWALYIYGRSGYHTGKTWFRKGKVKYPDEEITAQEAKHRVDKAIRDKREVRICDDGDLLVFHSSGGVVHFPDNPDEFWKKAGLA